MQNVRHSVAAIMKKPALFIHIPKTAGTTLQHIISRNYAEDEIHAFYDAENQEAAIIKALQQRKSGILYGHFDLRESFQTNPYFAFSFLRNPVDRVISNYLHIKYSNDALHKTWMAEVNDFTDFLKLPQGANWQSRFLAGFKHQAPQNDTQLEAQALANAKKLDFIGITELFDVSICILATKLNWKKLGYGRQNVSEHKREFDDLKSTYEAEITAVNTIDLLLYEFGLKRLEEERKKLSRIQQLICKLRRLR